MPKPQKARRGDEPANETLGVIRRDEIYPLPIFKRLSGLSDWAMREARKKGLSVRGAGNRKYVLGDEWYQYLATVGGHP
jgi:hypothetical protein